MNANRTGQKMNSLGQNFSANLCSVLAVSGRERENNSPGPVTATKIQQKTGVARSTLRVLKSKSANPDLETIEKIADVLEIPPAFLIMRPKDWVTLGNAIMQCGDFMIAAEKLKKNNNFEVGNVVEKVMRECKVHPDIRPNGIGPLDEVNRMNARDEWRRRNALKLNALALRGMNSEEAKVALAAVAGAMVCKSTPYDPKIED